MNIRVLVIPSSMIESIELHSEVLKSIPRAAVVFSSEYELVRTKLINNPEFTNFTYLLPMEYFLLESLPLVTSKFVNYFNGMVKSGLYHEKTHIVVILKDKYLKDIPSKDYDDGDLSLKDYIGIRDDWGIIKNDVLDNVENEPKVIVGQTIHINQEVKQSDQ